MSKAAVVAATQAAALEFGPRGIRVNAVCPGGVRTPLAVAVNGEALDKVMKILSPLGRIGRPEEIAAMVHFLRSEEHTSELQSLMRTSYAVFCLNINTTPIRLYTPTHPYRHYNRICFNLTNLYL